MSLDRSRLASIAAPYADEPKRFEDKAASFTIDGKVFTPTVE
jgi:hypothetical protein